MTYPNLQYILYTLYHVPGCVSVIYSVLVHAYNIISRVMRNLEIQIKSQIAKFISEKLRLKE